MEHGNNKLAEKIHSMSKAYEKLADITLLLYGNLHVIHIISKNEKVSWMDKMKSLDSCVDDEKRK